MEEAQHGVKRKTLHLDVVESVRLSQSEEGTSSLRQPIDRSHPQACPEQVMMPHYRGHSKDRPPRTVVTTDQDRNGTASSWTQGSVPGEQANSWAENPHDEVEPGQNEECLEGYRQPCTPPSGSVQKRLCSDQAVTSRFHSQSNFRAPQRTVMTANQNSSTSSTASSSAELQESVPVSPCVPSARLHIEVGQTFGLLNDSKVEVVSENWFQKLPVEVMENIFCRLPMEDLCLSVRRVCSSWNRIVSSDTFMPWKKKYHSIKKGGRESNQYKDFVQDIEKKGLKSPCLKELIRYMETFKVVSPYNNICSLLKVHPKYKMALIIAEKKAPDCFKDGEPNPWCMICTLILVSATVEDVHYILRLLTTAHCLLPCVEIMESFYRIATFLLYWKYTSCQLDALSGNKTVTSDTDRKRTDQHYLNLEESLRTGATCSLHYRIFCALYLFENSVILPPSMLQQALQVAPEQQSLASLGDTGERLTSEQMRIVTYTPALNSGEMIKVSAYAGSGKTTVLLRYARLRPHLRFLLLVASEATCKQARAKSPPNVTCWTGHGLALKTTGPRYAYRNKLDTGGISLCCLAKVLERKWRSEQDVHSFLVMKTLLNFLSSSDERVMPHHVPAKNCRFKELEKSTEYCWTCMKDPDDVEAVMTADGCLKLLQLNKHTLADYDMILVDDAQDLSPALLDMVAHQQQPKILVWDQHQQIDAFEGAMNLMDNLKADTVFSLTQSVRFGPEIGQVANTLLESCKNETARTIVGHSTSGTINGKKIGQVAVLCQNNFDIFQQAFKHCLSANQSIRFAFVGGLESYQLANLLRVSQALVKNRRWYAELSRLPHCPIWTRKHLKDQKWSTESAGLLLEDFVTRLTIKYTWSLPEILKKIQARTVGNIQQADVVFSTISKAKGLEFSTVKLVDSSQDSCKKDRLFHVDDCVERNELYISEEDVNSLYVAVTRARHSLVLSDRLRSLHILLGGACYYPRLTEEIKAEGVKIRCLSAYVTGFRPKAVTMYRPRMTVAEKTTYEPGVVSPAVLRRDVSRCLFSKCEKNVSVESDDDLEEEQDVGSNGRDKDTDRNFFNPIFKSSFLNMMN